MKTYILFFLMLFYHPLAFSNEALMELKKLNINPSQITTSGVSSGAFMAIQLQVAFSSLFSGVGSIAGGPWGCSGGNIYIAQLNCLENPALIQTQILVNAAYANYYLGFIDNPKNLQNVNVYLFGSDKDQTVKYPALKKLEEFFGQLTPSKNIKIVNNLNIGHGQPTLGYGHICGPGASSPWLKDCNYDSAGEILSFLYKDNNFLRKTANKNSLFKFNQKPYNKLISHLDEYGWIYIPKACQNLTQCRLHVAFHGCRQGGEVLMDEYVNNVGYNEWAEGSNIVVLYPQVKRSAVNPRGCWDWFGYTGTAYATKFGPQMSAIHSMILKLTK